MTQQNWAARRCPLCGSPVDRTRQDWCPGCRVSLHSNTYRELLEADEALQACQRSYDVLAERWTQWGERRTMLVEQLSAERGRFATPAQQSSAAAAPAVPTVTEPTVSEPAVAEPSFAEPAPEVPVEQAPTPASAAPTPDDTPVAAQAAPPEPAPARPAYAAPAHEMPAQVAPTKPAGPPRRTLGEIFTAPVLLGVSGASLLIAAAIVAVALTWATATPVVRGLLVLVVAGGVAALAVLLRRLHLVITSGAVGIVAMGFAGTSAVAFLSESPALAVYSAPVAFLFAGIAGVILSRLTLAWVGPSSAIALTGFAIALTAVITTQADHAWAIWAWSLTGVITAFGLSATHDLWPWRFAQHVVVWGGIGWVGITGAVAALWVWVGDASGVGALAALVPVVALAVQARRWGQIPVVFAVVLMTVIAPGIAYAFGASAWQQFAALAVALAVAVAIGGRLPASARRAALASMAPGYVVAWVATVGYVALGLLRRVDGLTMGQPFADPSASALNLWAGVTALVLGVAVAGLRAWKMTDLQVSSGVQTAIGISGPIAVVAGMAVATVGATGLTADAWAAWVWVGTGALLAMALAATHKLWVWKQSQTIATWAGVVWAIIVGLVVTVWAWSGDLTVTGALAGLVPVAALFVLVRWVPRVPGIAAVVLATLVVPSVVYSAGGSQWLQTAVVAFMIALGVAAGIRLSATRRQSLAIGLAPAFVFVALNTGGYALTSLATRIGIAAADSLHLPGVGLGVPQAVDPWAGVTALIAGLAVAGVRLWRLRDGDRDVATWLRAGAVVGALMVAAGLTTLATAVVDVAHSDRAHVTLASALSVVAVLLMLARMLWTDRIVKNVSSGAGVVLVSLAAAHGVWGLTIGELPVLGGLAIALVPAVVLAVWGTKRPFEGTALATLQVTAIGTGLALALDAPVALAFAVSVALAAVAAWAVRFFPGPHQKLVLAGVLPALVWGVISGLTSAVSALGWLDLARWTPNGWVAIAALLAGTALAATRTGPWRPWARIAEPLGAVLVLIGLPVALAAGAVLTVLNKPSVALGTPIIGALIAAAGLAWWKDSLARRLTRIGTVAWVFAAGVLGWINVAYSSWHFATTLALSVLAVVLLLIASRWWPRVALAPATLLLTFAPVTAAVRAELGLTAAVTLLTVGAALVLLVLTMMPVRLRFLGLIGVIPALVVGAAAALNVTVIAAVGVLGAGRYSFVLEAHWWALGLTVALVVAAALLRRLDVHRVVVAAAQYLSASTLVGVTVVGTAAFSRLVAPEQANAEARLLLAPAVAGVIGAAVVVWTFLARRIGKPRTRMPANALEITRWGAVGWVVAMAIVLMGWIWHENVSWLAGTGIVLALAVGLGVLGRFWTYGGLVPAVALLTVLPFVVVPAAFDATFTVGASVATVLIAAAVWAAKPLANPRRRAVLLGTVPAAIGAIVPVLMTGLLTFAALTEHVLSSNPQTDMSTPTWWQVGAFAAAAVALLALPKTEQLRGWLLIGVAVVTSAALPPVWAVVLLSLTSLAVLFAGKWLRTGSVSAGVAVAFAMVWSVGSDAALGITALTATVIAVTVAVGWRTRALTWGAVVAPLTALVAGIFVSRSLDAAMVAVPVGVGLSLVAVLALMSIARDRLRDPVAAIAVVITIFAPLFAASTAMMGLAYALGAVTWWRLFSAGLSWAKWMCTVTASAGAAALLWSINIQIIEAYTLVPAVALLLVGLQWMHERPDLRSLTALWPGLAVALAPSYLALLLEPEALWRTITLVVATIVLALVGVRLRWFAPILGTAVTAVVVSVLQMIVGDNLVVRLIAFAVVGALLLVVSSYFERLKEMR